MADPRFFSTEGPFALSELAEIAGATVAEGHPADLLLNAVAPLDQAGDSHISFLDNRKYVDAFVNSAAAACIVHPDFASRAPKGMALLLTQQPYHGYARIADAFHKVRPTSSGRDAAAMIDPSAQIADGVTIAPGVIIGPDVRIGPNTVIGCNAVVMRGVEIGAGCSIGAQTTLQCCIIGDGVTILSGARIGQDGFGFALGAAGHERVPQLGRVIIGNGVDIGANTAIDRGAGPDTIIGDGCKIDNLVQIGHNVQLGRGCVVVAQVGISGSTVIGDGVVLGGQVGIAGHLTIGSGAQIAAQSGVMRNVEPGQKLGGSPALPMKAWMRAVATLERMANPAKKSRGEG